MADYIPRPDAEFGSWLGTFATGVAAVAAKYGIAATIVAQVKADSLMWNYITTNNDNVANFATSFNSFKRSLRSGPNSGPSMAFPTPPAFASIPASVANGIERRARIVAGIIKANKTVNTEADNKLLGIMGEDPVQTLSELDDMKPLLTIIMSGGKVLVKWKKGMADSINIYVQRGDGEYVFLGNDAQPDFTDNTALPAEATTWTYRAIYVVKDTEVGQFSEAVSINVKKFV